MATGTIDQLNFQVILNDEDFNTRVQKDIALAEKLNTSISGLMNVKLSTKQIISSAGVKNAQQMSQYLTEITNKIHSMPKGSFLVGDADKLNTTLQQVSVQLDKIIAKQNQHSAAIGKTSSQAYNMARILRTISTLTGSAFSIYGLRRFLSALVDITGQFEVQRMALRSMLQDIDGADKIFEDLYRFSSESTYRFSELAKYAKQLAAFNIDKSDLLETTKMLGDVASGVGVSMDRIILAYGHVKSSGFLRGIQLRSFSQNGIPVLEELSKILTEVKQKTVSLGDVFDLMMKREIPFEMVEQAFKNMTSEGGKFYKMQEVLAKTLAGQINILKGRWENLLAAIGQANSGALKSVVSSVSNLISNMDNLGRILSEIAIGFGAYRGALLVSIAVTKTFSKAVEHSLLGSLEKLTAWLLSNPYALFAAGVATATVAIYKFSTKLSEVDKIQRSVEKTINDYNVSLATEIGELDRLFTKLKLVKEGTEEYDAAKRSIENRFGPYLQELRNEGVVVTNLAENYELLRGKIEAAARARALEAGSETLSTQLAESTKVIEKKLETTLKTVAANLSESEKEVLSDFVFGIIDESNLALNGLDQYFDKGNYNGPNSGPSYNPTYTIRQLRNQYEAIVVGYNKGMNKIEERFKVLNNIINPAGGGGEKYYDIKSIVEGIKAYDREINALTETAASRKITEAEKTRLTQLREARKEQADLYKEIMGVDYDKSTGGSKKAKLDPITETVNKILEDTEEEINKNLLAMLDKDTRELEKQLDRREKALTDYEKFYKDWAGTDFGKEGTGAGYKVSSIITDYKNKDKAADDKYYKGLALIQEGHKGNAKAIEREAKKLRELREQQKNMNRVDFMEKLRGTADDIFKEGMFGYDLTDWADKSLSDILAISDAIKNLSIPDEVAKQLSPEELAAVNEELGKIKDKFMQGTVIPALTKNAVKPAKQIAEYLGKAGDAMIRLGEAINDVSLSDMGKALNAISQNLDAAAKGYEAAQSMGAGAYSWIGAVVGGLADIFGQVTDAVAASNEKMRELEDTFRNIRLDVEQSKFADLLSGDVDGIFGENFVKRIKNATTAIGQLSDKMGDLEAKRRAFAEVYMRQEIGSLTHGTAQVIENILANTPTPAVGDMKFITNHSWLTGNTYKTISEIAKEMNMELTDLNGNLNPKLLQEILNTYGDLNEGAKEWLTGAIEYSEEYQKSLDQIDEATKDIFDKLASDITDKFIDNFIQMGNAVDDLSDTFADLGDTILRSFLQSYILEEILGKYENEARNALTKYSKGEMTPDEYAAWLDGFAQNIQEESETLAPAINGMIEAFKDRGLMNIDEDTANSLGAGFKSITEEQAGLLASYLNAIRADVSVMRGSQEKGWSVIENIGSSFPTLNDYLAQIAATNFDIAQSNQSILSELQSVIGSEDSSGMVVRVQTV